MPGDEFVIEEDFDNSNESIMYKPSSLFQSLTLQEYNNPSVKTIENYLPEYLETESSENKSILKSGSKANPSLHRQILKTRFSSISNHLSARRTKTYANPI